MDNESTLITSFPVQNISESKKTKEWRKRVIDWCDNRCSYDNSVIRSSVAHKKINYDLLDGKIHIEDMELMLNPEGLDVSYIPDNIQHYPIMNSVLAVLEGEELARITDYRVVVTNPLAISEIEKQKTEEIKKKIQEIVENQNITNEEAEKQANELQQYYNYEYQDYREARANALLNHYWKEQNFPIIFQSGFKDLKAVAEEVYRCCIRGGEPILERLDPMKLRVIRSGTSSKIEDADILVYEDYWSPSKIIEAFSDGSDDGLTNNDIKKLMKLDSLKSGIVTDEFGFVDETETPMADFLSAKDIIDFEDGKTNLSPYDGNGNVKVLECYWKSLRKIKQVKSYNLETGQEEYNFYTEDYEIDKDRGEEETIFWVNEAWHGIKIGKDIYIKMGPCEIQYSKMSNPSACHFGIIGTIYNHADNEPYSLVDMMKPYNYSYDIIKYRLDSINNHNLGKLVKLDFAFKPKDMTVEDVIAVAKQSGVWLVNSFNEAGQGGHTNMLAGALNNNTNGVVDAELASSIQQLQQYLAYIKDEMQSVIGMTPQRLGEVQNRETVGGVERATLQSSHSTESWFAQHEDTIKRALECWLETAKIASKGKTLKFQYILPGFSTKMVEIDGDAFAECDYGLVCESSRVTQKMDQKIDMMVQAGMQNGLINFSNALKLYSSMSISDKFKIIERSEMMQQQQAQEQAQQQQQLEQQKIQAEQEAKMQELQQKDTLNKRDNDTKILIAEINSRAEEARLALMNRDYDENGVRDSEESQKEYEFKEKEMKFKQELEKQKLDFEKQKHSDDVRLKEKQIAKQSQKSATKK